MDLSEKIRRSLGDDWLPAIYKTKIRSGRTRAVSLDIAAREHHAEILYTLLGVELKIGNRRFGCPDLATARYMRVFARIGCPAFAVPYDITRISFAADELETSWQRTLLLLASETSHRPKSSVIQLRSRLVKAIRMEIEEIGPGDAMPAFDRKTRQRAD